jgi:hypothetical protein
MTTMAIARPQVGGGAVRSGGYGRSTVSKV